MVDGEEQGAETEPPNPVTDEIVRRLLVLVDQLRAHFELVAAEFGLTPTQALALRFLRGPVRMGRLAEVLHCERSNVTLIVDRLTERGVVERHPDPADRRVRRLTLTTAGDQLRENFEFRLFQQIPAVGGLNERERRAFRDLLRRLTPEAENYLYDVPAAKDEGSAGGRDDDNG